MEFIKEHIPLFTQSNNNIWTDTHLAPQMLAAHLASDNEGATRKPEFVQNSVNWLSSRFPSAAHPQLLDLGCGPGIYAEKFQQEGYQVTGIDFSKISIDYAKNSAHAQELAITYLQGDYLKTDFSTNQFDLIVMIYCDLGVLSHKQRKIVLEKIYRALKPNGKFIFDVFTQQRYRGFQDSTQWIIDENNFWSVAKCLHLQRNQKYPETTTYLEEHYLIYKEAVKEFFIWETTFEVKALKRELADIGFQSCEIYSDVAGKKWQDDSETICFIASK